MTQLNISPEENKALGELKLRIAALKVNAFDHVIMGMNMQPSIMGYKSHEEMALAAIRDAKKKIDSETKAFLKLFPDER